MFLPVTTSDKVQLITTSKQFLCGAKLCSLEAHCTGLNGIILTKKKKKDLVQMYFRLDDFGRTINVSISENEISAMFTLSFFRKVPTFLQWKQACFFYSKYTIEQTYLSTPLIYSNSSLQLYFKITK